MPTYFSFLHSTFLIVFSLCSLFSEWRSELQLYDEKSGSMLKGGEYNQIMSKDSSKPNEKLMEYKDDPGEKPSLRFNLSWPASKFYNWNTRMPLHRNEIDREPNFEENYPVWLRTRVNELFDKFTDVNEGENNLMKLWNEFRYKTPLYFADKHIPDACRDFVEQHRNILQQKFRRNFICHTCNLFDLGLLSSEDVREIVGKMNAGRRKRTISNVDQDADEACPSPGGHRRKIIRKQG